MIQCGISGLFVISLITGMPLPGDTRDTVGPVCFSWNLIRTQDTVQETWRAI